MHFTQLASVVLAALAIQGPLVLAAFDPLWEGVAIQDFQGNRFDIAYGSAAERTPIQTLEPKRLSTQQWNVEMDFAAGHARILSRAAGTYMSFSNARVEDARSPVCAQICGDKTETLWRLKQISEQGREFHIIEVKSGLAMTSWPKGNSSRIGQTTPLTLQEHDSQAPQQRFEFLDLTGKPLV
ncbi:hypothetical protein MKEN_00156800 [Mycena kentingensis (nom. inval.)]|nr:hypothetical protein MKEN_00156800 [Mycena kentingensis (nom. inval.)]